MNTHESGERPHRKKWLRGLLVLTVLLLAGATAAIASARVAGRGLAGHGFCKQGMMRDMVEFRIHRALKEVNATEEQEQKILAVFENELAKHKELATTHEEWHLKVRAALSGDTVDRAALEAIRVQAIQKADERSKDLVKSVAEAAEVLTPAQRRQLADRFEKRFE
ncbi:MAG: Spy/CpxP family protein refolding chaperone [Acidobacteria bacterium]|nr:Spy/CpxP family protein refolding chaperone [Acidobacteriota bacterium]